MVADAPSSDARKGASSKILPVLTKSDEKAMQQWREGELFGLADTVLLILGVVVVVVALLIALQVTSGSPLPQAEEEQGIVQRGGVERRLGWLSKNLDLSEEQKERIRPLLEAERKQVTALRQDASVSPQDRRAKIQEIRKQTRKQMGQVLSPEQRQKLDAMRDRMQHRNRQPGDK